MGIMATPTPGTTIQRDHQCRRLKVDKDTCSFMKLGIILTGRNRRERFEIWCGGWAKYVDSRECRQERNLMRSGLEACH